MKTLEVLDHVLKGRILSKSSVRHYKYVLTKLSRFSEEWPTMRVQFNEFFNSCADVADTSRKSYYRVIKAAAAYMVDWGIPDATIGLKPPKVLSKERRIFTLPELMSIIKACSNEGEKLLVLSLLDSGARIGEISGLRPQDVGADYLLVTGKTGEHRYRCNSGLCDRLREYGKGRNFIFTKSMTLSHPSLQITKIRRIVVRAGLKGKKLGPHTFRHTVGSLIADATGSPIAVQATLQQSSISTAMGYIHTADTRKAQRISPIQLMNDGLGIKADPDMTQLALSSPGDTVIIQGQNSVPVYDNIVDLLALEYRDVPDGILVTCKFNSDNLRLLKRAFMGYTSTRISEEDGVALKNLYKRMTRLIK